MFKTSTVFGRESRRREVQKQRRDGCHHQESTNRVARSVCWLVATAASGGSGQMGRTPEAMLGSTVLSVVVIGTHEAEAWSRPVNVHNGSIIIVYIQHSDEDDLK